MRKTTSGFTIVELLIVIVVIAILAAITIVAYNGIQERAKTTQQVGAVGQYVKAFSLYTADKGKYPYEGSNLSGDTACVYPATCGSGGNATLTASLKSNMSQYLSTDPSFNSAVTMNYSTIGGYTGAYFYVTFTGTLTNCPDISGLIFLNTTVGNPTVCRYRPTITP